MRDESQNGGGYCMIGDGAGGIKSYYVDDQEFYEILSTPSALSTTISEPEQVYRGITTFQTSGTTTVTGTKAQPWPNVSYNGMFRFTKGIAVTGLLYY